MTLVKINNNWRHSAYGKLVQKTLPVPAMSSSTDWKTVGSYNTSDLPDGLYMVQFSAVLTSGARNSAIFTVESTGFDQDVPAFKTHYLRSPMPGSLWAIISVPYRINKANNIGTSINVKANTGPTGSIPAGTMYANFIKIR